MIGAERKYKIHDAELLAIDENCRQCQYYIK